MDWDKLKIFYAVAEAGSFTRATINLNLSQSAISRQIQSLEEDNECKKLVKKYKNITIKYIHTTVKLNKKEFVLVNSCNNSDYCTDSHRKSKIKLCTAPIIEYLKLQPNHAVCEIDDILVYYHSLLSSNSKIISKTENYSKTIGLNEIYSLKLLLNIHQK